MISGDKIHIKRLKIFAHHGVFDFEREQGQVFYLSGTFYLDLQKSGQSDDLEDSVSYADISTFLATYLTENTFQLIEAAAEHAIWALFQRFPRIQKIHFAIDKPEAPLQEEFESVRVELERQRHQVFVAFGSNMGDSQTILSQAIERLKNHPACEVKAVSTIIKSSPYGGVAQNDFYNGVLELETWYEPYGLLHLLQEIEQEFGRTREIHWGPRTLDLDIIFFDQLILDEPDLVIPHSDMIHRDFVCKPLCEIAPHIRHPLLKKTMRELVAEIEEQHII